MTRHIRLGEALAAFEGLALFRGLFAGTDEAAQARIEELREILGADEGEPRDVPVLEVGEGYARWATTYDAPGNPVVSAEQPAVWELLERVDRGRALDAACGTGRHARHLVDRGHEVTGVDQSAEMLARARQRVPEARFQHGDIRDLPFEADSFEVAVCALALEHFGDLEAPIAELARVVSPGGAIVVSESHPALRALGGGPFFRDAAGASGVVRTHQHLHCDYLEAFAVAGLGVRGCREVRFGRDEVAMQEPIASMYPDAAEAALLGFPGVLVWDLVVPA